MKRIQMGFMRSPAEGDLRGEYESFILNSHFSVYGQTFGCEKPRGVSRKGRAYYYLAKSNRSGVWQRTLDNRGLLCWCLGWRRYHKPCPPAGFSLSNGETLKTGCGRPELAIHAAYALRARAPILRRHGHKGLLGAERQRVDGCLGAELHRRRRTTVKIDIRPLSEILGLDYDDDR